MEGGTRAWDWDTQNAPNGTLRPDLPPEKSGGEKSSQQVPVWTVEDFQESDMEQPSGEDAGYRKRAGMGLTASLTPTHQTNNVKNEKVHFKYNNFSNLPQSKDPLAPPPTMKPPSYPGNRDDTAFRSLMEYCWPFHRRRYSDPITTKNNVFPSPARTNKGSAHRHQHHQATCTLIKEENARILLLAMFISLYLLMGAGVFEALESPNEEDDRSIAAIDVERKTATVKLSLTVGNCTWSVIEDLLYR